MRGRPRVCPAVFLFFPLLIFFLNGCKPPETARVRAIVGAVLLDGAGGPPVSNSVVLVSGPSVAMAGARTAIAIPQGAEEIDGTGKFLMPGIVNLYASRAESPVTTLGRMRTLGAQATVEEARRPGAVDALLLDGAPAAVEEAALEQARQDGRPVFGRVSTLAQARRLVAAGAGGLLGMIQDTETIEPEFIARLRDLRVVWAPMLSGLTGAALETARRNTKRLAGGGVPIAVASGAAPVLRELELLQDAGLPPGDVLMAATRNGAMALRKSRELGTVQPGRRADLLLLTANPIEDIRNLQTVSRMMRNGEWAQ